MKYKDKFDHLGQMREGDFLPWTTAEKALFWVCGLAMFVLVALELV